MVMKIYGKQPKNKDGEYFVLNSGEWIPLANIIATVAPTITEQYGQWNSIEFDGLDSVLSETLADLLDKAVKSGKIADLIVLDDAEKNATPLEECLWCKGTGIRTSDFGWRENETSSDDYWKREQCKACGGTGEVKHITAETDSTSVSVIKAVIRFLRNCGGFKMD